jgi:hypothetical protein
MHKEYLRIKCTEFNGALQHMYTLAKAPILCTFFLKHAKTVGLLTYYDNVETIYIPTVYHTQCAESKL